ncbi:MAG: hypothetical protein NTNFB02_10270 [Nitrospira sp.]
MSIRCSIWLCILLLAGVVPAFADTKSITAEATYIMGDGETPDFAEARVLQKAKQAALEEAGTYVESYTKAQHLDVTADEIETIAGGVLQVDILEKARTLVAEGLRFYIKIHATVTTDRMEELARRIRGRNIAGEYRQLQEEYAKVSRELDDWKRRAAQTAPGRDRAAALEHIREGAQAFTRVQSEEGELFERLVSGSQLGDTADHQKDVLDGLLQAILTSGFVVTVGAPQATPLSGHPSDRLLTIPIAMRVSQALREALDAGARELGGTVRPETAVSLEGGRTSFPLRFGRDAHYGVQETSTGALLRDGAMVTLVRIAKELEVATYFQNEVMRLALAVEFLHDTTALASCRIGPELMGVLARGEAEWFPLRRLFPVEQIRYQHTPSGRMFIRISNGDYDLRVDRRSAADSNFVTEAEKGYVAVIRDDAPFTVQYRLPAQAVKRLTSIRVRAFLSNGLVTPARRQGEPDRCIIAH